ncbi:MAG: RNA-dependent RNA polymerase [Sanya chuvirus 2]|nr:MAG: RNA-dependent RNA polymerase [Sanya chuvirus 2]
MFESQRKILFDSPLTIVHSRKLDTALRKTTAPQFINRLTKDVLKPDDQFFIAACEALDPDIDMFEVRPNKHLWGRILLDTLQGKNKVMNQSHRRVSNLVIQNLELQLGMNTKSVHPDLPHPSAIHLQKHRDKILNLPDEIVCVMDLVLAFEQCVEKLGVGHTTNSFTPEERARTLAPLCHWSSESYGMQIAWSNMMLFLRYRGQDTLVPRDYLLLMHNKASDILSILIFAHLVSGAGLDHSAYDQTVRMIVSMCETVITYQARAYHVFKIIEAIGTGQTLVDVDGPTNRKFLIDIQDTLYHEHGINVQELDFYTVMKEASIPLRHELMCLTKIMGHPFVDMAEGTFALHKKTTAQKNLNWDLILNSVRHAKRNYIRGHVLKKGCWPPCHLLWKTKLSKPWADGRDPDSNRYTAIRGPVALEDYDSVEILPALKFSKMENIIPYLKDKTITVLRSKVLAKYIEHSDEERSEWAETRLLLYYLFNTMAKTDHIEYLNKWIDDESLDFDLLADYLVIRVVPKEKEMKEAYRGFGCKTYLDRMRSLIQETNTAHYLDLFSSEQAMTLDELDILQKLVWFRRIKRAYKAYTPLYLVIDSSGWNNMFRHETVGPIAEQVLDKIFDTKIFEKTMLAYEHTFYYVDDRDDMYYWNGQLGGIEGLNQYTWDVVYLAQIRAAIEGCGFDPILFAKGDDLRAVVMVPPAMLQNQTIDDIRISLVSRIKERMEKLGHKINIHESYGSKAYFAFSKAASVGMIELPQTFRKIQKCYGANNAFLPFLDDYIASSFSNAHSACKTTVNTVACFTVALFWSYHHLTRHPRYQQCTDDELVALLLVPSMLGGFPIIYLHNMWVRAESDLLSPFFQQLSHCELRAPEVASVMRNFLQAYILDPEEAFSGLLIDPYSLPIKKPISASTAMRNLIMPALKPRIKNEQVKQLIEAAASEDMKAVIDTLRSANVYSVKLLSAIYAASPQGLIQELTRKFESGRSVMDLTVLRWRKYEASRKVRGILRCDDRVHHHRAQVVKGNHDYTHDMNAWITKIDCPAEKAQIIRDKSWGKKIEGISMPPVQHQMILIPEHAASENDWARRNHFSYSYALPTQILNPDYAPLPLFTASDKKPFVGYKTKLGMSTPKEALLESDEILDKVKNLIDLLSWVRMHALTAPTNVEPNLDQVIFTLLTLYIDVNPHRLTPYRGVRKSGSIQHHVRAPHFREAIVPNTLSTVYTRFEGCSNTHLTLRNSGHHYKVNFLHLFCHGAFLLSLPHQFCNEEYTGIIQTWAVTTDCHYCCTPIVETAITVDLSLLRGVSFDALNATKLSEHAREILARSLATRPERLERDIRPTEIIAPAIAQAGILAEVLMGHHIMRERLNDYNYHHVMDDEAYEIMGGIAGLRMSRQVSLTELKKVPIDIMFDSMLVCCVEYIYNHCRLNADDMIANWIYSQPAVQMPWEPFVRTIYSIGKMTMLVQYASRRSGLPCPDVFDSPTAASMFLAHACYITYQHKDIVALPLVFMTEYIVDSFPNMVEPHLRILRHRWVKTRVYPQISLLPRGETAQERDEGRFLMAVLIMFWACPYVDYEENEEIITRTPINTTVTIPVLNLNLFTLDDIPGGVDELPGCARAVFNVPRFHCTFEEAANELFDLTVRQQVVQFLSTLDPPADMVICRTTLQDCINVVRTCDTIEAVLANDVRVEHVGQELETKAPRDVPGRICTILPYSAESDHMETARYPVEAPLPMPTRHLEPWHLFRTIGFGTSSPSKLLYILTSLGLFRLPERCAYAALADGHGGFASTIDSLTMYSRILFNTLIVQYEAETQPSAWNYSESPNSVEYTSLREGISDLASRHTVVSLESSFQYRLAIITCDAQTHHMTPPKRLSLVSNVLHYYVRNRIDSGVLIMKMYYNEPDLLFRAVAFLRRYCLHVYLFKPAASGRNVEVYLVGVGTSNPFLGTYGILPQAYPPAQTELYIHGWLGQVRNLYPWGSETEINVDFSQVLSTRTLHLTYPLALRKIASLCGVTFTLTEWNHYSSREAWTHLCDEVIRRLSCSCSESIADLRRLESEPDNRPEGAPVWNENTLAHKRHIASMLMRALACRWIIRERTIRGQIYEMQCRATFQSFCDVIRARSSVIPHDIDVFYSWEAVLPGDWQLYKDFQTGVAVGLNLIGYVFERQIRPVPNPRHQ